MTAIDQAAFESARRVLDPIARAAIVAKAKADASWYAGILAGLTQAAHDSDAQIAQHLTSELCRVEESLVEVVYVLSNGRMGALRERVTA